MDIFSLTIVQLRKELDQKNISAVEVTQQCLDRIEKYEPQLHAFVTVTKDTALSQAKVADERIAKGESTPLLGVPYTLKDIFCTSEIPTTAGSNILKEYVPVYDATIYTKLKESGAVLLGKTNCDAWGHGSSTENSDFGPTHNPWNLEYVPGGSSGGSAAAVAAGFGFFSVAEDTGGSIRLPASFCNCTGMKVTYGRVSRYGAIAYASSLDTVGPLTKTVEDCELVLHVLAGQDPLDSTTLHDKLESSKNIKAQNFTIGLPKEFFTDGINPEVKARIMESVKLLESLGVKFKEVSIPSTEYGVAAYYLIAPSETSSNLGRYDGIRYGNERATFGAEAKRRIMLGTLALSPDMYQKTYLKAQKVRTVLKREFEAAFEEVDAILGPVSPTPAFKIGEMADDPLAMYLGDVYTVLVNPTGSPSLSLPSGFSENGLPIGMQLIGKVGSESTLFALGNLYQKNTTWHTKQPELAL